MDLTPIFKAYDVRGIVPDQIDAEVARRIGIGFATFASSSPIALGHDCRLSSPDLAEALTAGIVGQGTDVIFLGPVTTDMIYYASGALDVPGVVITASHNPPEWNGFKFCLAGAAPVGEDSGLVEIRQAAETPPPSADAAGTVSEQAVTGGYVDHLFSIVDADRIAGLRVVADGGNGMAGLVLERVLSRTRAELTGLFLEPDGRFPNHPADPLRPENLRDLLELMDRERPDLGVAFDGDADRAFFVDDQGRSLPGSTITAIIARWLLDRHPGEAIVHNLICSKAVPEIVASAGGRPVRTRVGHSFIKEVMKETGAIFGGEHSGHYYFRDNYRADSGILAMLVLLQVLSEAGRPLSAVRGPYEPYVQSGEINFDVALKDLAVDTVAEAFATESQDRLDGLTVDMGRQWFNLRPSNTEPVLRLNVEGGDAETVEEIVSRIGGILEVVR